MRVLSLDPALRNIGYIISDYHGSDFEYISSGVLTTARLEFSGTNILEQAKQLLKGLKPLLESIDVVCSELNMMSQNYNNAVTNGVMAGLLAYIAMHKPLITVTTHEAKKAVSRTVKVDKLVCMAWASNILPSHLIPKIRGKINQDKFNHIADSLAVLHCVKPKLDLIMKAKITIETADVQLAVVEYMKNKGVEVSQKDIVLFDEEDTEVTNLKAEIDLDIAELAKLSTSKPSTPKTRAKRGTRKTPATPIEPQAKEVIAEETPKPVVEEVNSNPLAEGNEDFESALGTNETKRLF